MIFTETPITILINKLLLGFTGTNIADNVYANIGSLLERLQFKEELEEIWWNQFYAQVLPSLVPLSKWTKKVPNREPGDKVLDLEPLTLPVQRTVIILSLGEIIVVNAETNDDVTVSHFSSSPSSLPPSMVTQTE